MAEEHSEMTLVLDLVCGGQAVRRFWYYTHLEGLPSAWRQM